MSSSSMVIKRTTTSLHPILQSSVTNFNKVQPRSSAERDNNELLLQSLKAASTDIANRLLDYASLDKLDCEASCILIALANHDDIKPKKPIKELQQQEKEEEAVIEVKEKPVEKNQITTIKVKPTSPPVKTTTMKSKNDPIMLLMAAAEVVNASDKKKKRSYRMDDYPHGRYYRKSEEDTITKRIRTNPPTPAPSYTTSDNNNWRNNHKYYKNHNDHQSSTREQSDLSMDTMTNNSFSRQYHSMKQNPKIKQNALHTYITYMIYNDLAHGGAARMQQYQQKQQQQQQQQSTPPPPPLNKPNYEPTSLNKYNYNNNKYHQPLQRSEYYGNSTPTSEHKPSLSSSASSAATSSLSDPPTAPWYTTNDNRPPLANNNDDRSILARPLTAFLWNNDTPLDNGGRKEVMILPPLNTPTTKSTSSAYDRLPPV